MDLDKAINMAQSLFKKHGLIDLDPPYIASNNWKFKFNTRFTSTLGRCVYTTKTIELGGVFVMNNTEDRVRRTILHEIAHALCPNDGHNWKWKRTCIAIGGDGQTRCSDSEVVVPEARRRKKSKIEMINVKGVYVKKGMELTLINGVKATFEYYDNNCSKYNFHVKVDGELGKVSEEQIKF